MTTVEVFAPAKINLALHVTGQRDDGNHELDTLVTFAGAGDYLRLSHYAVSSITVEGPEARGVPADTNNLAFKAASLASPDQAFSIILNKQVPVASGIGGGSADAAAAARGAMVLALENSVSKTSSNARFLDNPVAGFLALGADVPMCMSNVPLRAKGVGEKMALVDMPLVHAVLANPRVPVSTPEVFKALAKKNNSELPTLPPAFESAGALIAWLGGCRNDLEEPAMTVAPVIEAVKTALAALPGAGLVRMSGSGATCFALFENETDARAGAQALRALRPDWWVVGTALGDWSDAAVPHVV